MNLLRLAFLLPALADFFLAAQTLHAYVGGAGDSAFLSLRFSGVAVAWGVLLLAGLRAPLQRAWILWPTMLAIAAICLAGGIGYLAGEYTLPRLIAALSAGTVLIALCLTALRFASTQRRTMEGSTPDGAAGRAEDPIEAVR